MCTIALHRWLRCVERGRRNSVARHRVQSSNAKPYRPGTRRTHPELRGLCIFNKSFHEQSGHVAMCVIAFDLRCNDNDRQ
jgi:hypothetical protein